MKMNFKSNSYTSRSYEVDHSSRELEPILDALAEISVQIRQVLQLSRGVVMKLEMQAHAATRFEAIELNSKKQAILANMASTEEAIDQMNREISVLLRIGSNSPRPQSANGQSPNGFRPKPDEQSLRPSQDH